MSECPHCNNTVEEDEITCPKCEKPIRSSQIPPHKVDMASLFGVAANPVPTDAFDKEDMISGLRSAAEGMPVEDFLPTTKWEDYTASLLDVFYKKHLIFPNEIDEALKPKSDKEED